MQAGVQSDRQPGAAPVADIDLGALRHALWRKKFLILGLTLLTAAIAFAGVNLVTPRYKSEARVLIEMRENIFFRPDAEKTADRSTTVDQEAVTSQVRLILSRDLAREVIKKLNLAARPEFDPVLGGSNLLRSMLSLAGIIQDPLDMMPEEQVYKSYYDRLSAFQVEKSGVIAIAFESQDPDLAAQVANAVAEAYLRFQQAAKQGQTRTAGARLSGEIERLRAQLAQAENKVEQYRSKINLFIGDNTTTLSSQQLGDFNGQLAAARALKADADAKLIGDALKAGTAIELSDITNSELMRRLFRETAARDSIGATAPDARLISTAAASTTPAWPKKLPIILVAALAMFTLSSVFILSSELLRTMPMQATAAMPSPAAAPASSPADASRAAELLSAARAMATARATPGARAEALERLARGLSVAGEGARRVTVVGTVRNVGTTMTAIALARSLACRSRVVLVELAVASPNLSVIASDPLAPGLSELVQGSATFGQIITRDRHSRAHLIMAGRVPGDAAAPMNSRWLAIAIEALARSYGHVVIDAGAADEIPLERFATLAPRAVLVAVDVDNSATALARDRLLKAGFANVSVLAEAPPGPDIGATGSRAAA